MYCEMRRRESVSWRLCQRGHARSATRGDSRCSSRLPEHEVVGVEVGAVAAARRGLEPGAIEDRHLAARIDDELAPLQRARRLGDADAAHAEHEGEELVGDMEGLRMR